MGFFVLCDGDYVNIKIISVLCVLCDGDYMLCDVNIKIISVLREYMLSVLCDGDYVTIYVLLSILFSSEPYSVVTCKGWY